MYSHANWKVISDLLLISKLHLKSRIPTIYNFAVIFP